MKYVLPLVVVLSCGPVWAQNPLSVRVVDAAGTPIAGAQVQVRIWSEKPMPMAPKATDASGAVKFSLPNGPDGKAMGASVVAGAKGFAFSSAKVVEGKAEVRLERGVAWRGKVVDEAGKPLARATIKVYGAMAERDYSHVVFLPEGREEQTSGNPLSALYTTQSKADGTFVIEHVPKEKELFFVATKPGFSFEESQGARADSEAHIQLERAGSLHGRVLGLNGKPLAGIQLFASSVGTGPGRRGMMSRLTKTDATGSFTITNLSPGLYKVVGSLPANTPYLIPRRTGVRVTVGNTAETGIWRAQKGVLIRGMVRDAASQKPIANASFYASSRDTGTDTYSVGATSDATGHFALRAFPGKYRVSSSGGAPGYLPSNATQTVTINAQGQQSGPPLNFALEKAVVVRGITLDEGGHPMPAHLTLGGIFDSDVESDAKGRWQYTPNRPGELGIGGGSDESGYFEVLSPKRVDWPVTAPITVTVKHRPWNTLTGRAVTPDGTPIEGVRVEGEFTVMLSDSGGYGAKRSAISDKDGCYTLTRLRDSRRRDVMNSDIKVSAQKDGYEFQSGGAVSHQGDTMTATDLVFVPLSGKIEGTTQPGAQVVIAGRETRADATGHFSFAALPVGDNLAFAARGNNFGSAPAKAPLAIKLQPLRPQEQDQALAEGMWANIKYAPGEQEQSLKEWLAQASFEDAMKKAQTAGDVDRISDAAERWQSGDSLDVLRAGLEAVKQSDRRADVFLKAALATNDAELMKQALEESEVIFKGPTTDTGWREPQLYRAAVLRERLNGAEDGRLALGRALAYTLQNHPEKSRIEGAMQTQVGRNEALCDAASIVAQGSPALLREVLDSIDDGSGFEVRALAEAIPVVAKAHGFAAAEPMLKELKHAPTPTLDMETHYVIFDPAWAYGYAVQAVIPLIGPKSPAKVLELARAVEDGEQGTDQRARALASAAKFQTPAVAAPLYREAVKKMGTDDAPHIAALVWERDPKLGQELFALVRQRVEAEMKQDFTWKNSWVPFAFYSARANPAQARLILEREWVKSRRAKVDTDDLALIAIAMSPVDARRALELTNQMPAGSGWTESARRKIARFVYADEATRRGFVLNRIGGANAWEPGAVQW